MKSWKTVADWGLQGGLLSENECETLFGLVCLAGPSLALEVGHYCGLSTYVIADALRTLLGTTGDIGNLTTVDSYEPDEWVTESGEERFEANRARLFPEVRALKQRSQDFDPSPYDFVFYDGDHGAEQLAFTRKVHDGVACRVFVFDDADFPVPQRCCTFLREHGWFQIPIPVYRGPYDKQTADTMTLAAFVRAK